MTVGSVVLAVLLAGCGAGIVYLVVCRTSRVVAAEVFDKLKESVAADLDYRTAKSRRRRITSPAKCLPPVPRSCDFAHADKSACGPQRAIGSSR
jgi:hypothetical protein